MGFLNKILVHDCVSPFIHLVSHFDFTLIIISQCFPLLLFLSFFHFIISLYIIFPEQVELKWLFLKTFSVYSLSPCLPMLNLVMALQASQQHILTFCREEGKWEFIHFLFKHNTSFSNCPPFLLFICTWRSSPAQPCCWTWQLSWRRVLQDVMSVKFFGMQNQAVTLHLSLYLMNRIHLLLDECFVLKDPAGSWPAFIWLMW